MGGQRLRIPIYGLGCGGGGATTVERALARAPGVLRIYVNPASEVAHLEVDPTRTDPGRLARVIEETGYRAGAVVEA